MARKQHPANASTFCHAEGKRICDQRYEEQHKSRAWRSRHGLPDGHRRQSSPGCLYRVPGTSCRGAHLGTNIQCRRARLFRTASLLLHASKGREKERRSNREKHEERKGRVWEQENHEHTKRMQPSPSSSLLYPWSTAHVNQTPSARRNIQSWYRRSRTPPSPRTGSRRGRTSSRRGGERREAKVVRDTSANAGVVMRGDGGLAWWVWRPWSEEKNDQPSETQPWRPIYAHPRSEQPPAAAPQRRPAHQTRPQGPVYGRTQQSCQTAAAETAAAYRGPFQGIRARPRHATTVRTVAVEHTCAGSAEYHQLPATPERHKILSRPHGRLGRKWVLTAPRPGQSAY